MLGNPTHLLDINLEIHHGHARVFFGPPVAFPPDPVLRFFQRPGDASKSLLKKLGVL